ncbi:MAG: homoserine dehydrogenase [Clostridia bacterium]|nr:homoserine dehydrogenase [Clostridia bacterium]
MVNVAILGFGVVGSGVAEVLTQNKSIIEKKLDKEINIKYILDLREFPGNPFESLVIHDFNIILNDPEVSVVAEMMGGSHPAYDFSKACLEAGKSVVTSNKEVVANFGTELLEIARAHGVAYLFEASVGGGIPIIRPMCNDLASNNITEISGILNGTTNYILTKMTTEGADFADVLKDAQDKGYAERNPAADVEGLDAARKIVILASLAFGKAISPNDIYVEGITNISTADVEMANSFGYAIKLIGHARRVDGRILAMVSPRLVPHSNPLSGINGVFNGILLGADMVGEVMFYGPGAGKLPTASAVCADIVDAIAHADGSIKLPEFKIAEASDIADVESYSCKRFFVFEKCPECALDVQTAEKCFGPISNFAIYGDKVALITGEMTEKDAAGLCAKLNGCKAYRLL